jgi:hypothetical protein
MAGCECEGKECYVRRLLHTSVHLKIVEHEIFTAAQGRIMRHFASRYSVMSVTISEVLESRGAIHKEFLETEHPELLVVNISW